ncbi:MAG: GspE/PulE family protein [bacterium]
MTFIDFLVEKKVIDKNDTTLLKNDLKKLSLDDALLNRGLTGNDIIELKGEYYNIPIRSIEDGSVPFDVLKYIPEESATHYNFVPIGVRDGFLEVGLVDPDNIEARDALNFIASKVNMPFKAYLITPEDFKRVLEVYKGLSGEVTKALTELDSELSEEEALLMDEKGTIQKSVTGTTIIEDAPVTKIVATILRYAVEGNASDVHIEPMADKVRVRFRMDGELGTSLILPLKVLPAVAARIKILCSMRLDEKRKPQDGSFSAKVEGRQVDFRVSTFPVVYGEKVVMRILDKEKGVKKLEDLGMTPENLALIREAIKRPFGLILISGPTGSGKSTTLYSMLNEIDKETNNVLSLEDPVEYNIPGISQSQVRPEIGYDFSTGLRTTLRQDPDVIMVGEIRDKETAQLAIQASLTGHLVLSTIHTNSSTGIVPRLIDMGVDPYLIPPTLILGIAQRLVRTLCPGAGKPLPINDSLTLMLNKQFEDLPESKRSKIVFPSEVLALSPSPDCPSGTRGREAVIEMFKMDSDIEKVILQSPVESEIYKVVRNKGMLTMKEDAILKAFNKKIPFEEVNNL